MKIVYDLMKLQNIKKNVYSNNTPTPSPRIKKRIRREEFLKQHKDMGRLVLKMAKSTEMLRNPDEMSNPSETTAVDFNMMTHQQVNLILSGVLNFPPNQ